MKIATFLLALMMTSAAHYDENRYLCCLCACGSQDGRRCVGFCLAMEHGAKIVEEPEMDLCTRLCAGKVPK